MSLIAHHTLVRQRRRGNITYVGSASIPVDNGSSIINPLTPTPPAGMVLGDIVIVFCTTRNTATAFSITNTGGQTWNSLTDVVQSSTSTRVFWCRFNGAWTGGNPTFSFSTGASTVHSVYMHVFRPTIPQNIWTLEVQGSTTIDGSNPLTISSITTTHQATLCIAFWFIANASTFSNLSGTGWNVLGSAQYRNLGGSDTSASFAYKVLPDIGATGNVEKDVSIAIAGQQYMLIFYEH